MSYQVAQPVVYELAHHLKLETAFKIAVNIDELQENILAATYNGAIPASMRRQICWLLTIVLPRSSNEGVQKLEVDEVNLVNMNLILWLLINYNNLPHRKERILLRTERKTISRTSYGILIPAACHPDSIGVLERGRLLDFGWMSSVPQNTKEEPKTTLLIPTDGHGGKYYQLGRVDEIPRLFEYDQLPKTTYRGPTLDWGSMSEELQKELQCLQKEQEVFTDIWKNATKKADHVQLRSRRDGSNELSPWRMMDSLFDGLLYKKAERREEKTAKPLRQVRFNLEPEDDEDLEVHEPYSLKLMAGALFVNPITESTDEERARSNKQEVDGNAS